MSGGVASLSWDWVEGATGYSILSTPPGGTATEIVVTPATTWTNPIHQDGESYAVSVLPAGGVPAECEVVPAPNCVTLQSGVPVIASGVNYRDSFDQTDAIWPGEASVGAAGSNFLYGYMWVPANWEVVGEGYYAILNPGSSGRTESQLDGTGTGGIKKFATYANLSYQLSGSDRTGFSPRGAFPTLQRLPKTADEHDGFFLLVGLNVWRNRTYVRDVTFSVQPRADFPNAPYVEPPCVAFADLIEGYGPTYQSSLWSALDLTPEFAATLTFLESLGDPEAIQAHIQRALAVVYDVVGGCVAAVVELFESILGVIELVADLIRDPQQFINEKVEQIRVAVEAAVADPGNAVTEAVKAAIKLDLLRENPARWVGEVGCQILVDILTGVAIAKVAERVLDFINARRADVDHKANCNSFPAGTLVLMGDGSYKAIESLTSGDLVWSFDAERRSWSYQPIVAVWSHVNDGWMTEISFADGSSITSTPDHLFWVESPSRWVRANELAAGDFVRSPALGQAQVSAVSTQLDHQQVVWEIDVANVNSFVVSTGSLEMVVHNADTECLLNLDNGDHRTAVRDAPDGTRAAALRDRLSQASRDFLNGELKVQVHHIFPRALRDDRNLPSTVNAADADFLVEIADRMEELGIDADDLENLIPMPSDRGQLEVLLQNDFVWPEHQVHVGPHRGEYFEGLARVFRESGIVDGDVGNASVDDIHGALEAAFRQIAEPPGDLRPASPPDPT